MKKLIFFAISLIVLFALGAQIPAGNVARAAQPLAHFNGDDYADLVIGVPYEAIGSEANAGAAHVLHGAASGLSAAGSQLWYQGNDGLPDVAEASDEFGYALAIGDFNGDTYHDLAIGVHGESIGDPVIAQAGAVHVLYGTASGLNTDADEIWV